MQIIRKIRKINMEIDSDNIVIRTFDRFCQIVLYFHFFLFFMIFTDMTIQQLGVFLVAIDMLVFWIIVGFFLATLLTNS